MANNSRPDEIVQIRCPVCGRIKPPDWGARDYRCFGEWRSNVPDRDGKTTDHEPSRFMAVTYRKAE